MGPTQLSDDLTAAACLFAIPALAATATTGASAKTAPDAMQVQQDLHQDLTKAGYTDIRIVPGSFLVRAKDKQGNETEMMISPHSIEGGHGDERSRCLDPD